MRVNKNIGVYLIRNIVSGKVYVGQSVNLKERKRAFFKFNQHYGGRRINSARKHYNSKSYWDYEILEYCTVEELDEREIYWIAQFDSTNPKIGYNLAIGGDGARGYKFSKEIRKKMSENSPVRKPIVQINRDNGEVIREWESIAAAAKYYNIRDSNISACCRHTVKSAFGFIWIYKKELSDYTYKGYVVEHPSAKPILQYDLNGDFVREWDNAFIAEKELKIRGIRGCCREKKHKSAGGYLWQYKTSDNYPLKIDAVNTYKDFGKHILQYSLDGDFIAEWRGVAEAARALKISEGVIANVCRGNKKTAGGYIWRRKTDNYPLKIDVNLAIDLGKHILQYDMNGNFVKEWINASEAERAINISSGSISHCINNKHSFSNGYVWRPKIADDFPLHIDIVISDKCGRRVMQYTLDGEFIKEWESARQAGIALGHKRGGSIPMCCNGKLKTAYGYKWRYA